MTLREVYISFGFEYDETVVRIYQYKHDLDDEVVIFDNLMRDSDIAPMEYLDSKVLWFTLHVTVNWLEVHLEA